MSEAELQLITQALTLISPFVVALIRRLTEDKVIPRFALPALAGAAGAGAVYVGDYVTGANVGPMQGMILGLATTGLRDIYSKFIKEGATPSA